MKTVTICITNYQSGEAIELAIESIRKHTARPFSIIVYDDATNEDRYSDLKYLRVARDKEWIKLIEGGARTGHNGALPRLLDAVTDDLAMVIDCDIQITGDGWLDEMVATQEAHNAAFIVDIESFPNNPIALQSWFFMLDMRQYPEFKTTWEYTKRPDFISWEVTPDALYATGYRVYERALNQGRIIIPVPITVRAKFQHFTHISVLSWPPNCPGYEIRQKRCAIIQAELRRLRENG